MQEHEYNYGCSEGRNFHSTSLRRSAAYVVDCCLSNKWNTQQANQLGGFRAQKNYSRSAHTGQDNTSPSQSTVQFHSEIAR